MSNLFSSAHQLSPACPLKLKLLVRIHYLWFGQFRLQNDGFPGDCFSCLFRYTARHTPSVYILLLAISGFAANLNNKKKKLERKTVFSLLTSHVIEMLARIVLRCDFYIQYYSFEWNYIIEGNPWHALLFYFASPTGNSAHHGKMPVKAPWKPAPR